MRVLIMLISLICIVSCGEADLNELKLDYSSIEAGQQSVSIIQSKLTKEQWQRFSEAKHNLVNDALRQAIKDKDPADDWELIVHDVNKRLLDGVSVAELIGSD